MKKLTVLAVAVAFMLGAGNVFALPVVPGDNGNEPTLQEIFDTTITGGTLDAYNDQSEVGVWYEAEANVDAYFVKMFRGDSGNLGIYSKSTGFEYDFSLGSDDTVGFGVNDAGDLWVDGALVEADFGDTFGFYWRNTSVPLMSYTEDEKNAVGTGYGDSNTLALRYLVKDGLSVATELNGGSTIAADGNNDWILAFEDRVNGDGDFNDAVFYIEDMNAVPEPGTLLLLGAGLLGLVGLRKRMQ